MINFLLHKISFGKNKFIFYSFDKYYKRNVHFIVSQRKLLYNVGVHQAYAL